MDPLRGLRWRGFLGTLACGLLGALLGIPSGHWDLGAAIGCELGLVAWGVLLFLVWRRSRRAGGA
jgi:hypothetical protein